MRVTYDQMFYTCDVCQIKLFSLPDTHHQKSLNEARKMPLQIGIGISATTWYLHGGHGEDLQLFVD